MPDAWVSASSLGLAGRQGTSGDADVGRSRNVTASDGSARTVRIESRTRNAASGADRPTVWDGIEARGLKGWEKGFAKR